MEQVVQLYLHGSTKQVNYASFKLKKYIQTASYSNIVKLLDEIDIVPFCCYLCYNPDISLILEHLYQNNPYILKYIDFPHLIEHHPQSENFMKYIDNFEHLVPYICVISDLKPIFMDRILRDYPHKLHQCIYRYLQNGNLRYLSNVKRELKIADCELINSNPTLRVKQINQISSRLLHNSNPRIFDFAARIMTPQIIAQNIDMIAANNLHYAVDFICNYKCKYNADFIYLHPQFNSDIWMRLDLYRKCRLENFMICINKLNTDIIRYMINRFRNKIKKKHIYGIMQHLMDYEQYICVIHELNITSFLCTGIIQSNDIRCLNLMMRYCKHITYNISKPMPLIFTHKLPRNLQYYTICDEPEYKKYVAGQLLNYERYWHVLPPICTHIYMCLSPRKRKRGTVSLTKYLKFMIIECYLREM